jgi:hypothetical protein
MDKPTPVDKNIVWNTDICSSFNTDACIFTECENKYCLFEEEVVSHSNMTDRNKRHKHRK